MNVVVFEDNTHNRFYPLSLTRPIWELRFGCFSIRERIERYISVNRNIFRNGKIFYLTRDYLKSFYKDRYREININDFSFLKSSEETLFINSRVLPSKRYLDIEKNEVCVDDGVPMLAFVDGRLIEKINKSNTNLIDFLLNSDDLKAVDKGDVDRVDYVWDLVVKNSMMIVEDFTYIKGENSTPIDKSVTIIGDEEQLYIEDNVRIDPFVCIDLTDGPVIIREGSVINSFTRIEGPCYIGRDCRILGAKIRGGCSIGDYCRLGGEVEGSIFYGYANKYHDGFIGHSCIGEWVNLGALTTNSDLKNNYTDVKTYIPDRRVGTGRMKVGCFVGDFTKTSIGTLINTGSSIGVGCMLVHCGGITPYHIPSFTWYLDNKIIERGGFDSFLRSCERMTSRRDVVFDENYANVIKEAYKITEEERKKVVDKWKEIAK